jgi:hypothetical protein
MKNKNDKNPLWRNNFVIKSIWKQPKDNFILFVDVLGTEQYMEYGYTPVFSTLLEWAVNEMKRVKLLCGVPDEGEKSVHFKMFSDNIFLCSESNWEFLLLVAAGLQRQLVESGLFVIVV